MHGPWPGEGPAPRYGPVDCVAVLADVHGNVPALRAVLADVERAGAELVVFCGDLTWGPQPELTIELVTALGERAVFVRGNADRAVVELARHGRAHQLARDPWMIEQHAPASVEFLAGFPFSAVVAVTGLGAVRCCHGSPRSDTELVTHRTPVERMARIAATIDEKVLVSGHTHLQFDRRVAGIRSVNAGSVGLPFHTGEPGTAYWAMLGPDVELRSSRYDVAEAIAAGRRAGDPGVEAMQSTLMSPPTPEDIVNHAEPLEFSD
jgi:predicted phosphodiesterase